MTRGADPAAGFRFRSALLADVAALERLQLASNGGHLDPRERIDFPSLLAPPPETKSVIRCATDATDQIVGFACAAVYAIEDEWRGDLDCLVHPALQGHGLESLLFEWAEMQARKLLSPIRGDRPPLLRIAFTDRRDAALRLYRRRGFECAFAVDIMRRNLRSAIPTIPLPEGFEIFPWDDSQSSVLHALYTATFRAQPRFADWSEKTWRLVLLESPAFRRDLSLVVCGGTEPAGYAVCWVEPPGPGQGPPGSGRIAQLAVHPTRQRRGLGSCLVIAALHAFAAAGLDEALLEVDSENIEARGFYQHLGFTSAAQLQVYTKPAT